MKAYREDVINGEIYDKINAKWNEELGTNYTYDEAKKKLISLFNTPNYLVEGNKHWNVFEGMYPAVAQYIFRLNTGFIRLKKQSTIDDNKCGFAYVTQGIEVILLLDVIINKVKEKDINIPTLSLHDGIFTTKENADIVRMVMLQCYKEFIVAEPIINTKS